MTSTIEMPLWTLALLLAFAAVTFASHFLFPSVRWFFRRRFERAVARLNKRLKRPIEPFKLARRHDMIQRLIYDPDVTQAIVEYARRNHVREDVAFQMARRYAREIVPSFSAVAYFGFGTRLAHWLASTLFIVRTGLNNNAVLEGIDKDATIIFIMNHRSNMDYVLVTTLAAQTSALSYAVGEWARVWPLTPVIKSMGAYFIRRKARGGLYRTVLSRYVQMATAGGAAQAIFPEGGLTLDGRLQKPKIGLLSSVVEAYHSKGRDVVFVPVAINYDRVLEDRILVAAGKRGDRDFSAKMSVVLRFFAKMIWQRARGRFQKFGVAAVIFGEPLKLSDYKETPALKDLAKEIMGRVENEMPYLFVPILSRVMLRHNQPLDIDTLQKAALESISQSSAPPPLVSRDAFRFVVTRALNSMVHHGMVHKMEDTWQRNEDDLPLLKFYANSIAHFYVDAAVAE